MEWHEREFERLDRQVDKLCKEKKELIEEILEGLKRLPDSKASFALIEEWEARKNVI